MHDMRKEMMDYADSAAHRKAEATKAAWFGEVVAIQSGMRYDIKGTDQAGVTTYVSNSVPRTKWQLGQWVMVEWSGLDWAITGMSPWAGESTV